MRGVKARGVASFNVELWYMQCSYRPDEIGYLSKSKSLLLT